MKKLFVLGSGIGYSLSPKIFSTLFELMGDRAEYGIVDISENDLENICSIKEGATGFNVTKPFKERIVKYLCRDHSGIGSVNTVKADSMEGFSTDGDGLLYDLRLGFGSVEGPMLVIGYGGAAKACIHALVKAGFEVSVTGRDLVKAAALATETGTKVYDGTKLEGVISCVSGTYVPSLPEKVKFCYDIRYNVEDTLKIGRYNRSGFGMLIAQAIYSYEIFFDKRFDKGEMQSVYCKIKEKL